jgi:hypothetical protein
MDTIYGVKAELVLEDKHGEYAVAGAFEIGSDCRVYLRDARVLDAMQKREDDVSSKRKVY